MLINRKVLSIPPYISTSWGHVAALSLKEGVLHVFLNDGAVIQLPHLKQMVIDQIFEEHLAHLKETADREEVKAKEEEPVGAALSFDFPFKLEIDGIQNLTSVLQHDMGLSANPDLPQEILDKVVMVAKMTGLLNVPQYMPQAEPHCNCPYCQIARVMHEQSGQGWQSEKPAIVEKVEWKVIEVGEKLYDVISSVDSSERYKVYLGDEVGCNCGKHGCDHILAVLRS